MLRQLGVHAWRYSLNNPITYCAAQIEQEVEGIREAHRILEASTVRREGLEKALRVKLEQEIWRFKEEGIKLKGEL